MKYNDDPASLKILMPDVDGWAIVKYDNGKATGPDVIYGEHIEGCLSKFDGEEAGWCWEYTDTDPDRVDSCWRCERPVPESVIGLVLMMNWRDV